MLFVWKKSGGCFLFFVMLACFGGLPSCSPTTPPCPACQTENEKAHQDEENASNEDAAASDALEASPEERIHEPLPDRFFEKIDEPLPETAPEKAPEKAYHPPVFLFPFDTNPVVWETKEEETTTLTITAEDFEGKPVPVYLLERPLGASWDQKTQRFSYRPTFIEAGSPAPKAIFRAEDGKSATEKQIEFRVADTIKPPTPQVIGQEVRADHTLLRVEQVTDAFLDSLGHAGRRFSALVSVPKNLVSGRRYPVRIVLHGFDSPLSLVGDDKSFHIAPHDPKNTYWWGYADSLPAKPPATGATIQPYTMRRVLHLLEWVLKTYPHADPDRAYIVGASMGGTGAKTIGLLYARHFCYVEATIGQTIPKLHRPSRLQQLASLWGDPTLGLLDDQGMPVWERLDTTRILRDHPEAKHQFVFTKHSKDDPTIHFGAAVMSSPLTGLSWYNALQSLRIGHYVVWDEGGHGSPDPILGDFWSDWGWDRIHDATTFFHQRRAFPAFSRTSADSSPGTGQARDARPWHADKGYAGTPTIPQDTGWDGEIAGAYNRHLRWDTTAIEDEPTRFRIPLRLFQGQGEPPPKAGYPTRGNLYAGNFPVYVDVTLRRIQRFLVQPHQEVLWSFGDLKGTQKADEEGIITLSRLPLLATWQTLTLTKQ